MRFKNYLIEEGIIVPKKLNLKSKDLDYLNKLHKSITFTNYHGEDIGGAYSHKTQTMKINFHDETPLDTLEGMVNHEIIHSIQHTLSKGNFEQRVINQVQEMNNLVDKMNDVLKDPDPMSRYEEFTDYQKLMDKLENNFHYNTHEEQMAYAYTLVKARKSMGFKTVNDVVRKIKWNAAFKLDNRIKKYIGMYWLVKDEL